MDKGFDSEFQDFQDFVGKKRDSAALLPLVEDGFAPHHRHRSYLLHCQGKKGDESYRPREWHRVSAKRWLEHTDEQVRQLTAHPGLSVAVPDWDDPQWALSNWRSWVWFAFAMDLGSDGVSATNWLENKKSANTDRSPDVNHGCNCDHPLILKAVRCHNFFLCMAVSWNLVFGVDRDQRRRMELGAVLKCFYVKAPKPRDAPLFMSRCLGIVACFKRNGYEFSSGAAEYEQAYELMKKRPLTWADGCRVTFARFCAGIHGCNKHTPWWEVEAYERVLLALETGVLKGQTAQKIRLALGPSEMANERGEPTTEGMTLEDRSSMRCCLNAIAHSAVMQEIPINQRICSVLGALGKPIQDFAAESGRACRSADKLEPWFIKMAATGVQAHLAEFMRTLSDVPVLQACGFLLNDLEMRNASEEDIFEDDEMADLLGTTAMHSVHFRQKRLAYMNLGVPWGLCKCLLNDEWAEKGMQTFKDHTLLWDLFFAHAEAPGGVSDEVAFKAASSAWKRLLSSSSPRARGSTTGSAKATSRASFGFEQDSQGRQSWSKRRSGI